MSEEQMDAYVNSLAKAELDKRDARIKVLEAERDDLRRLADAVFYFVARTEETIHASQEPMKALLLSLGYDVDAESERAYLEREASGE